MYNEDLTAPPLSFGAGVVSVIFRPMAKEKVAVYIDGGNTYRKLKDLGIPDSDKRFNYSQFVDYLVGEREVVSKRYYVGRVRNFDNTDRSEKLVRKQQQFLDSLANQGFQVKEGKIMYDRAGIREKGVDVKLSVDLVTGAFDQRYDTAILISSDTDLIPAIQYVIKGKDKKVEYIGFSGSPSFGLLKESSIQRLLSRADIEAFQDLK